MNLSEAVLLNQPNCEQLFEENGYVILRQFIPRIMCDYISANIKVLEANSSFGYGDNQVEKAFSAGALTVTETLLDIMTLTLSKAINCELYPTYSYMRIYLKGADLEKHQDRPSCEVSATVPLSYDSPSIWPLYIETGNKVTAVKLEPGDALIYKGIEVPHWREAFEGERQVQVFLHYVKKNGDYSEYKFDKRPGLGHHY
ncbi:MAG: hypothetical protein M3R52_02900 [Acidobacteriota bacterium]|nr:hypothetical protein [Acidobacteriota bacterium]